MTQINRYFITSTVTGKDKQYRLGFRTREQLVEAAQKAVKAYAAQQYSGCILLYNGETAGYNYLVLQDGKVVYKGQDPESFCGQPSPLAAEYAMEQEQELNAVYSDPSPATQL